jgi:hypothetical protein
MMFLVPGKFLAARGLGSEGLGSDGMAFTEHSAGRSTANH